MHSQNTAPLYVPAIVLAFVASVIGYILMTPQPMDASDVAAMCSEGCGSLRIVSAPRNQYVKVTFTSDQRVMLNFPQDGRVRGKQFEACYYIDCNLISRWGDTNVASFRITGVIVFRQLSDQQVDELYGSNSQRRI